MTELLTRTDLYEQDFVLWLEHQAALLRAGRLEEVDAARIAEELEDMARSDRRELRSRIETLLLHLLKWDHQPRRRSRSWRASIVEQRIRIADLLEDSPSLRQGLSAILPRAYRAAVQRAVAETGLAPEAFPRALPYDQEAVLRQEDPFAQRV